MTESRRPPRKHSTRPAPARISDAPRTSSVTETAPAPPRLRPEVTNLRDAIRPTDLASVTRTIAALRQRLAEREAELDRLRHERAGDADTIAEMLVRIAGLERKAREVEPKKPKPSTKPPARDDSLQRLASLEARIEEAEARARTAEARADDAEARLRKHEQRIEELTREHDALRAQLSDADTRAKTLEGQRSQAEETAKSARVRAIELSERVEALEAAVEAAEARARAAEAAQASRDEARRALEEERQAHAAALAAARAEGRAHEAALETVKRQLESVSFDRDVADEQASLLRMQARAAEARVDLVDRQLEWAEEAFDGAHAILVDLERRTRELDETRLQASAILETMRERLGSARGALFTNVEPSIAPPAGDPPQVDDAPALAGEPANDVPTEIELSAADLVDDLSSQAPPAGVEEAEAAIVEAATVEEATVEEASSDDEADEAADASGAEEAASSDSLDAAWDEHQTSPSVAPSVAPSGMPAARPKGRGKRKGKRRR